MSASVSSSSAASVAATPQDTQDQNITRSLADGTSGLSLFTTNDLANNLGKVALEQDEYYLLGYTPAVDSPEESCHELRVKVDRGGLEVRARKRVRDVKVRAGNQAARLSAQKSSNL
jgi:hypothetical protein